jgi:3-hydroxyisobutyrate dehydrogenase-like beta-hydroxyacid dehydrogenase
MNTIQHVGFMGLGDQGTPMAHAIYQKRVPRLVATARLMRSAGGRHASHGDFGRGALRGVDVQCV